LRIDPEMPPGRQPFPDRKACSIIHCQSTGGRSISL
jgi:hypothetical protein